MSLQRKKSGVICYVAISVIWLVSNTGRLASAWSWISWQMLGALSNTPNAAWCTEYRLLKCRTCLENCLSEMVDGVTHLDNIMYVVCIFISVVHEVDVDWVVQLYAAVIDVTLSTGDISEASPTSIQYRETTAAWSLIPAGHDWTVPWRWDDTWYICHQLQRHIRGRVAVRSEGQWKPTSNLFRQVHIEGNSDPKLGRLYHHGYSWRKCDINVTVVL